MGRFENILDLFLENLLQLLPKAIGGFCRISSIPKIHLQVIRFVKNIAKNNHRNQNLKIQTVKIEGTRFDCSAFNLLTVRL